MTLKQRLAPFLVLLEARYLPLMFLALPQAYTVALWLAESNRGKFGDIFFAVIGAAAFEFTYVGAIAWGENKTAGKWVWGTALLALIFSVMVSVKVYYPTEGLSALLHAGFPLVAFGYTMVVHSASGQPQPQVASEPQPITATRLANRNEPIADGGMSDDEFDINELLALPVLATSSTVATMGNEPKIEWQPQTQPVGNTSPNSQWQEALRLRMGGLSYPAIVKEMGVEVSDTTIRNWVRWAKEGK